MTPKIQIERLEKTFEAKGRAVRALAGIDLAVAPAAFVSVVGASGCGKSTLLRILAGLDQATAGVVRVNGRPVTGPGKERAMVFQQYSLFPWLTVLENIRFSRRLAAHQDVFQPPAEALRMADRAHALLQVMGLEAAQGAYPNQLSGGMQQRVAIARALLSRPEVLLMDEPFGALDAQTRGVMHDLLLHLFHLEKTTICFVTHDVEEAIYLSQRVVVLAPNPGRVDRVLEVPLPRERHAELKLAPEFIALKREILHRIEATSGMQTDRAVLNRLSGARASA